MKIMTLDNEFFRFSKYCHAITYGMCVALAAMITLFFTAPAQAAEQLIATVDRNHISMEETLTLNVRFNKQVMLDEPDFSLLQQHFDVLTNKRSNQYRNINGRAESWTQWSLVLAPKQEGKLFIPSFELDGNFSEAIEITVDTAASTTINSDKPVYLESELESQQAFVQQQVLYTVRLHTRVGIVSVNRSDFAVDNTLMKQVDETQYQKVIGGQTYAVVEIVYALFPQQSGELTIPATQWDITTQSRGGYYDPIFNRGGQRLRLRTQAQTLTVQPKPDSYTAADWLPANNIQLQEQWSSTPDEFIVGEPITRQIQINAEGLMASQLPPLQIPTVKDLKYYPDQPKAEETQTKKGISTQKTESYAIVPSQPGRYTLPAITLDWWDNNTQRQRQAHLPERHITVTAAAGTTIKTTLPTENSAERDSLKLSNAVSPTITDTADTTNTNNKGSSLWFYSTLGLATLSLLLGVICWQQRHALNRLHSKHSTTLLPDSQTIAEDQAFKQLKKFMNSDDLLAIRQALLSWTIAYVRELPREFRPGGQPTLAYLADQSEALAYCIQCLDAALYSSKQAQAFDARVLLHEINSLRNRDNSLHKNDALKPLYATR